MKYAVIGLGAVGTIVGGLLTKSHDDVILIGKKNQVERIKKKGIRIQGINRITEVKKINVSDDFSSLSDVDIIIVCVKSQDTESLSKNLKKHIKKSALIISLQNGIKNSYILEEITGIKTISGIILFNAMYFKPGLVEITIKGGVLLESSELYGKKIDEFIGILKKGGLNTFSVKNIEGYLWSKLILNLQNAVDTLTGQTIKQSIIDKNSRQILIATMKEGLTVLENSGIELGYLPRIDPRKMIKRLSMYNTLFLKVGTYLMGIKENAKNSMSQSILRNKNSEIDYMNGEIVTLANKNNIEAPINSRLVELVKDLEKSQTKKSYDPVDLRRILSI